MLIDKAIVEIIAGNGGDGAIAFRREACVDKGGPSGGDGGRGGSVIFVGDNNVNTLLEFKYKRKIKAEDGENGKTKKYLIIYMDQQEQEKQKYFYLVQKKF